VTDVTGQIDLHCHPLPAIDDGPRTVGESLAFARAARAAGITTLVATPHVNLGHPENDAARIAQRVDVLRSALHAEEIDVDLVAGAEVALAPALALDEAALGALHLGAGPWLLLECPLGPAGAEGFTDGARELAARGHRIVLAHPERSRAFHAAPEATLAPLVEEGMLAQVTAGALVGRFGRKVREIALSMLHAGLVHDVASDAHDAIGRVPSIGPELEAAGFGDQASWLAAEVPAAILSGGAIPPAPPFPEAPKGWRRLLR
jgi:protein-tyrosine phosphatase